MDILSARKKAAERKKAGKKTKAEPKQEAPPAAPVEALPQPELAAPAEPTAAAPPPDAMASVPEAAHEAPAPEQAAEEAKEQEAQELEMLSFRLGSEEYVVMIDRIREVLKLRDITPVPRAADHVLGVSSLRGSVLPVIDLHKRLGLGPGARDEKSRIIVVGLEDEEAGLLVDRVTGVVKFPADAVKPAPETVEQGAGAEFIRGITRKDDKLYILLDVEKAAGK